MIKQVKMNLDSETEKIINDLIDSGDFATMKVCNNESIKARLEIKLWFVIIASVVLGIALPSAIQDWKRLLK